MRRGAVVAGVGAGNGERDRLAGAGVESAASERFADPKTMS